jgi:hypothetical protein
MFPATLNVLDKHYGFTAVLPDGDTLWRPGHLLKNPVGVLVESSVAPAQYQNLMGCSSALYKVEGYRYPIRVWMTSDGKRFA